MRGKVGVGDIVIVIVIVIGLGLMWLMQRLRPFIQLCLKRSSRLRTGNIMASIGRVTKFKE